MLVLTRKIGERILIEPGIEIAIIDVRSGKVRIGIEAPSVRIRRTSNWPSYPQSDLSVLPPASENALQSAAAVSTVS